LDKKRSTLCAGKRRIGLKERVKKYGLLGAGNRVRVRKIGLMKAVYQNGAMKSEMLKQVHDKIDNGSRV
jgi:hypothetical protein